MAQRVYSFGRLCLQGQDALARVMLEGLATIGEMSCFGGGQSSLRDISINPVHAHEQLNIVLGEPLSRRAHFVVLYGSSLILQHSTTTQVCFGQTIRTESDGFAAALYIRKAYR